MRRVFVFALLAGTLGIVASQFRAPASPKFGEHHVIGERASLKVAFFGCANLDDESRVVSIAEHDFDAGIRTALQAGCRYFHAGHVGIIKSSDGRSTMFVSVRMATLTATGFPQLFWNERQRERLAARSTHRGRGKRRDYAQCEEKVVASFTCGNSRDGSDILGPPHGCSQGVNLYSTKESRSCDRTSQGRIVSKAVAQYIGVRTLSGGGAWTSRRSEDG